jgi:tetratricopeptide (TPR) repeat protein
VATSYNNMGLVFDSQGDYPKALEYHEKSLEIRLSTLGADHPDVASSYYCMGFVFDDQGDYPKALEYMEKCLEIRLSMLGADHIDMHVIMLSKKISTYIPGIGCLIG